MSPDDKLSGETRPEDPVGTLLAYARLLNTPRLARLYTYVLREGPVTVETTKAELGMPHSTAYKYVSELEEMGLLTRHEGENPTRVTVAPIRLVLETDHDEVVATPVLVAAVARQLDTEDIRVFVERHGIPKLAAALHYTLRVMNGEMTQRTAARKLDVHPVEGMTVITTLQDVIESASEDDPFFDDPE